MVFRMDPPSPQPSWFRGYPKTLQDGETLTEHAKPERAVGGFETEP